MGVSLPSWVTKIKASTAYTDFVRVLDNEGKRQFSKIHGVGFRTRQASELNNLINVGA